MMAVTNKKISRLDTEKLINSFPFYAHIHTYSRSEVDKTHADVDA